MSHVVDPPYAMSSLDHLEPWMPWARDQPQPLAEKVALAHLHLEAFDAACSRVL